MKANGMNKIQHKFYTKCVTKAKSGNYKMCEAGLGRDKKVI